VLYNNVVTEISIFGKIIISIGFEKKSEIYNLYFISNSINNTDDVVL